MSCSTSLQDIAEQIYNQGEITFNDQKIFKNETWFLHEMEKLIRFGKVEKKISFLNGSKKTLNRYYLNPAGKVWVEIAILEWRKRVER